MTTWRRTPTWRPSSQSQSQYFLGECKNWSKPVDPKEIDSFRLDIKRRFGRCRLGFFIALGGFTKGFHSRLEAAREDDVLIVAIEAAQMTELVEAKDRNEKLKELHRRAIMARTEDN